MLTVMKGIIRGYFLLFTPILVLVLVGGYLLGDALLERELYRVRSDESTFLSLASGRLDDELAVPLRHVRSMSEDPILLEAAGRNERDNIAAQFTVLMNRNPDYAQVRWLAPDGMELVRFNRQGQHLQRVPDDQLQNKRIVTISAMPWRCPGSGSTSRRSISTSSRGDRSPLQSHDPYCQASAPGRSRSGLAAHQRAGRRMLKVFANSSGRAADHTMLLNQDGCGCAARIRHKSGASCSNVRTSP